MKESQLTLYKLMILYLGNKVDFPLSNSQISEFIIDRGYTDYFNVQLALHQLEEDEMIRSETVRNMSRFHLTDTGKEAIEMFEFQISDSIKDDIMDFLEQKEFQLRKETDLEADFFPAKRDEYTVRLRIKEKDTLLLELNLNVTSRAQAVYVCDHWKNNHSDVYTYLVQNLLLGDSPQED